jgi:hypothetical protein
MQVRVTFHIYGLFSLITCFADTPIVRLVVEAIPFRAVVAILRGLLALQATEPIGSVLRLVVPALRFRAPPAPHATSISPLQLLTLLLLSRTVLRASPVVAPTAQVAWDYCARLAQALIRTVGSALPDLLILQSGFLLLLHLLHNLNKHQLVLL